MLKSWTWQFVWIRPVCSVLMILLQLLEIYPTWLSWVFTIILNISISLALYSLVIFYHVFAKELVPHKPLAKFMCVKGIVFFCFWQGFVLEILVALGLVKSNHFWLDVAHLQEALQNAIFAIFQQHAYSTDLYSKPAISGTTSKKTEQAGHQVYCISQKSALWMLLVCLPLSTRCWCCTCLLEMS